MCRSGAGYVAVLTTGGWCGGCGSCQALEFFEQLSSSRSAAVDVRALCCLTAVHASGGDLRAAEEAAARAAEAAARRGQAPPPEATYALLQGYGARRDLQGGLRAFRRLLSSGGRPHRKMCEFAYRMCLDAFEFRAAGQVRAWRGCWGAGAGAVHGVVEDRW